MTLLLVIIGGAVGAPLRYVVDLAVPSRHRSVFPWGTFTVNVVGSLLLGAVASGAAHGRQVSYGQPPPTDLALVLPPGRTPAAPGRRRTQERNGAGYSAS